MRWVAYLLIGLLGVAGIAYAAFAISPWPSVLLIRYAFHKDTVARNEALARHVPEGIVAATDVAYGPGADERLDIFHPAGVAGSGNVFPVVVWIHGGGFVYGDKSDVREYLQILASQGFITVAVGYTTAPTAQYPTPVEQANEALGFLSTNAARFQIDRRRIFLAGDSAGAQIAAQTAAMLTNSDYAQVMKIAPALEPEQLQGVVLFCGIFDAERMGTDGPFGGFLRTVLWSYFGTRDASGDPRLAEFSVASHVTSVFPPVFISVGNADPLAPQSLDLAAAATAQGVKVDTLFFATDHRPPLPHEYQFDLDGEAGRQALDALADFLKRHSL